MTNQIGIIGVGNMGEALLAGLIRSGYSPAYISIAVRRPEIAKKLEVQYGVKSQQLSEVAGSNILIIAVKPKDILELCESISPYLSAQTLVISVAAGKTIASLEASLGGIAIARVMPNTPTMVGKGMAGISYNSRVTDVQKELARKIFGASGKWVEVDESLQDAVTATSGSGPAYFFAFVEAMIEGAEKLGLPHHIAKQLAVQTIVGAAEMLETSGKEAAELRENVTSPNGTTFAALSQFDSGGLKTLVADSMAAAARRSKELA